MYTGRVACCPLVSHDEYADGTDGQTLERYITLSAMVAASATTHSSKVIRYVSLICTE